MSRINRGSWQQPSACSVLRGILANGRMASLRHELVSSDTVYPHRYRMVAAIPPAPSSRPAWVLVRVFLFSATLGLRTFAAMLPT